MAINLTGPIICILIGFVIFAVAWLSGHGPPDHNIGRGIANSIMRQGFAIVGGFISICGVAWLLIRWLDRSSE
ncbi:hypothetical protein [Sulfitobacter sp. S190]|uniref:hypothetical protein n=1 Tax=Sulfitobacter sp. S190 TaxID=2867022 RepID=UPI0021A5C87F|nr:hypothetical protein [Sulfitobacter sp. S190]UWR24516.1 hypothetical protein K3756_18880 [Sulfitobacter sp. S190]